MKQWCEAVAAGQIEGGDNLKGTLQVAEVSSDGVCSQSARRVTSFAAADELSRHAQAQTHSRVTSHYACSCLLYEVGHQVLRC